MQHTPVLAKRTQVRRRALTLCRCSRHGSGSAEEREAAGQARPSPLSLQSYGERSQRSPVQPASRDRSLPSVYAQQRILSEFVVQTSTSTDTEKTEQANAVLGEDAVCFREEVAAFAVPLSKKQELSSVIEPRRSLGMVLATDCLTQAEATIHHPQCLVHAVAFTEKHRMDAESLLSEDVKVGAQVMRSHSPIQRPEFGERDEKSRVIVSERVDFRVKRMQFQANRWIKLIA